MSSVSALTSNASGLNFTGLATGIDTSSIITGLTKLNQQRIDQLNSQKSDIVTKQTTFATLQAKLFDLQTKANTLARSAGGAFDARTASVSDPTVLSVTAGTAAIPGNYTITVNSLAQAEQVTSQGFTDPNATIQQGTLTVQVGSGTATTVTIDSRNNTLQGLANAINTAGGDVKASIINDGSSSPYRLLLTSSQTGAANTISITNNLTTGTGASINPANTVLQAASDAQVTLGTGTSALNVTSPTNQLNSLIPGLSLNLLSASPSKQISLSVANDTTGATTAVQNFVDSYNAVRDFLTQQTQYDASTQTAGPLLGNSDVNALENDLSNALTASIPGLSGSANRLSTVGLAFDGNGDLTFDSSKLTAALNGQNGVTATDVKNLFALTGSSDNPGVAFVLGSSKTQPTNGSPYQVQVTSPATRATVTATGSPAPSIVISPPDNTLSVKVNGLLAAGVTLPAGTYSPTEMAAILQQQINAAPELQNNSVSVGLDSSGKFQITSQLFGGSSQVAVTGGSAAGLLGFLGNESATGTNVAGNFLVNGKVEPATGAGQVLTGVSGNTNTDGLQVRSSLTDPGTADVTVTRGLASLLNNVLNTYLDPNNGRLKSINDAFTQQTTDIDNTIKNQNDILTQKTTDLQNQFSAMETAVSNLKTLQSQLANLPIYTGSTSSN